jgi:hypothetical protein
MIKDKNNNISIKTLVIIPKRRTYCHYYINNNLKDSHTMKYEQLYLFICNYITAKNTLKVQDLLSKKLPFIVDVENNIVSRLKYDTQKEVEKLRKDFKQESMTGFLKKFNSQIDKEKDDNSIYDFLNKTNKEKDLEAQVGKLQKATLINSEKNIL